MDFKHEPTHKVVLGLGYGDEGKGMAVAHEVARALAFGLRPLVVRFNGGPQAAHNVRVQTEDGEILHHTHSQFGSGALLGAKTILTKGMLFDPLSVASEASHLSFVTKRDVMPELMVDKACPVVLPIHAYANRQLERNRGERRHGSTGRGIGAARMCEHACKSGDVDPDMLIDVRSLFDATSLHDKTRFWTDWISRRYAIDMPETDMRLAEDLADGMRHLVECGLRVTEFADETVRSSMHDGHCVIFEGSQGLLLDERYGMFPHVTYGDMTADGAFDVAGRVLPVMGVTRSYQTRHGAGPLLTEGTYDAPEEDNGTTEWAGGFRTGLFDADKFELVTSCERFSEIAVSHMDSYPGRYCRHGLDEVDADADTFIWDIELLSNALVTVIGKGNMVHQWEDR